jgi:hypothetical protein
MGVVHSEEVQVALVGTEVVGYGLGYGRSLLAVLDLKDAHFSAPANLRVGQRSC